MTDPAAEPRTAAGRVLLEREAYNSRSFAIVRLEDVLAIEAEAALPAAPSVAPDPLRQGTAYPARRVTVKPAGEPPALAGHDYKTCSMCQEYIKHFLTL